MNLFERLGLTPTPPEAFQKAADAFTALDPTRLSSLLKKHPRLHPLSAAPLRDENGDTLLHAWARLSPTPGPDALAITQLLLGQWAMETTHTDEVTVLTSKVGNLAGQTPQMIAARHGNWGLLRQLPYNRSVGGHRDHDGLHWVDHWAAGILERHASGQPLGPLEDDPAVSAFKAVERERDLYWLSDSKSPKGTPLARLLAAGVDWTLTEHLLPSDDRLEDAPVVLDEAYPQAKRALYPNKYVMGLEGTEPAPLAVLVAQNQPFEAMAWLMEGQSHGRPSPLEEHRWMDLLKDGSSPAAHLANRPDVLLEGIRRRWFCRGSFSPKRFLGLSEALEKMMDHPEQVDYVTPLLEEISVRCAPDAGRDFGVRWRQARLNVQLPQTQTVKPKPRL